MEYELSALQCLHPHTFILGGSIDFVFFFNYLIIHNMGTLECICILSVVITNVSYEWLLLLLLFLPFPDLRYCTKKMFQTRTTNINWFQNLMRACRNVVEYKVCIEPFRPFKCDSLKALRGSSGIFTSKWTRLAKWDLGHSEQIKS